MDSQVLYHRYRDLQDYVGWEPADAERVRAAGRDLAPAFGALVDDFYREMERHPDASKVLTGGRVQIERLRGSLRRWLDELFQGVYDADYVTRRWRVGLRHVQIGLDPVFVNAAMARLRAGLLDHYERICQGSVVDPIKTRQAVNKLLDLDLAIVQDVYQTEYLERQRRVERLAAIGQVAGGIAHELRNPLHVIKTSVYFLNTARQITPEKLAIHLERIDRQTSLAEGVITALHDFARLPMPHLQPVSLFELLSELVQEFDVDSAVEFLLDCSASLPPVCADWNQLRIVFSNLVRNAKEAMPEGGTVSLTAREIPGYLEVDVADTGVGISDENLSRIMEPFHSTKARGLGLGLAIARAILDRHDADIRVASTLGLGTTFTIVLPLYTETATSVAS